MKKELLFMLLSIMIGHGQSLSTASSQVSTFDLAAPQLGTQKKIWVWQPKDYAETKEHYPVIYMHDGQNLFDATTSYVGEWNVDEILDSLKAKVIIVGIEHGGLKRIEELTPFAHAKHGGGKADAYLNFVTKTLKPYIDKNYRTKGDAKNTAIFGSSLGGLISYYAILRYPETFGKAGVFSPSFWFTKDIYTLTENTKKIPAKIYFLSGDNESKEADVVGDMERMEELASGKGAKTKVRVIKGGEHNEKLWRESFAKAYLWLME